MRAIGGSFEVESTPGLGTRCTLHIPLPVQPAPDTSVPLPTIATAPRSSGAATKDEPVRILLVDDHTMVRQGLRSILDSYPDMQVVAEAADGEAAIQAVKQFDPAVVVIDINMPRLNGIEATIRMKSMRPQLCVIGLSLNADRHNTKAMMSAGASFLLSKEAAVEELYSTICRAVDQSMERG